MGNFYKYKNLVFEGGGVKGIAYGGALSRLEELGILSDIKRVAGTSAGAITATLLALGYDSASISSIIAETNFKKFEDDTFLFIRDIVRLIKKYGWNKGDTFEKWISSLIEKKTGDKNFTFEQLHRKVSEGVPCFKDLYVVATNVSKQKAEVISYETYPNLPIYKAIRMSMSIPVFFSAVKDEKGDYYVDGGLTSNYAIQIFDNIKYVLNQDNCLFSPLADSEDYAFNFETLGFRVDSNKERNYLNPTWEGDPNATKNLKKFIMALIDFTIEMVNKKHLNKNDWNRTVFIDSGDIGTTEFKLNKDKIEFLINSGKRNVDDYFFWKNNDSKWSKFPR